MLACSFLLRALPQPLHLSEDYPLPSHFDQPLTLEVIQCVHYRFTVRAEHIGQILMAVPRDHQILLFLEAWTSDRTHSPLNQRKSRSTTHYALYRAIVFGPSPLTWTQREVVATVVSLLNQCHRRIHHYGEALGQVQRGDPTLLRALVDGFRLAPVSPAERVMLQYVERMTSEPRSIAESDVRSLRVGGWDDRAIHDMSQVISYFNYLNRLADGFGVSPEAEWSPSWPD